MASHFPHPSDEISARFTRLFACLVILSIWILTVQPQPAASRSALSGAVTPAMPGLQPPGPEIIARRTATSKHFQRGPGQYQAWISSAPIHARDARGSWQEITAPQTSIDLKPSQSDTFLFNSILTDNGVKPEAWIGMYGSTGAPLRILISWNLNSASGLPRSANIDEDADAVTVQLYQTGYYGAPTNMFIGLYSISAYWSETKADWFQAAEDTPWTTPGGDYDSLLSWINVDDTPGYKSWYSLSLRDDVAVERNFWYEPLGSYGALTYGYLLKTTQETGDYLKYFAAREYTEAAKRPVMVVNYSDPIALAHRTPLTRRVPSPDSFTIPASAQWRAVGLRQANPNASYILSLYEDAAFLHSQISSISPGPVEFVVLTSEALDQAYYPRTNVSGAQTGSYAIEYVERLAALGTIDPGDSFGPYTIQPQNVLSLYSFTGAADQPGCLRLTPTGGDAQLGLAVFKPGTGPTPVLQGRQQALAAALAAASGQPAVVNYSMPAAGSYGLLVWNQASSAATTFTIQACKSVYLPVIRK